MKKIYTAQEILVLINTKFAAKEWIEKNEQNANRPPVEQLADACWNGMLHDRLPELGLMVNYKNLPIWELREGNHLLYMKLGEQDEAPEAEFTINPYLWGDNCCLN